MAQRCSFRLVPGHRFATLIDAALLVAQSWNQTFTFANATPAYPLRIEVGTRSIEQGTRGWQKWSMRGQLSPSEEVPKHTAAAQLGLSSCCIHNNCASDADPFAPWCLLLCSSGTRMWCCGTDPLGSARCSLTRCGNVSEPMVADTVRHGGCTVQLNKVWYVAHCLGVGHLLGHLLRLM